MQVKDNRSSARFEVTADGRGVTGRAGLALVGEVADTVGLVQGLSEGTGHARRWLVHDPGVVLCDVAVMLADGGTALRHLGVLDGQPELFGQPASPATANRTLVAVADDEQAMAGVATARRQARVRAWACGGAPPVVKEAAGRQGGRPSGPLCVDLDATIAVAHSDDKDGAGPTYKGSWGFHPMMAYLDREDGGGEALAGMLRSGNAGANDAGDHIAIFDAAREQLPALPQGLACLVRTDTAGASHNFLDHVREQDNWRFSTGFPLTGPVQEAIRCLDDHDWQPAICQDGTLREGAHVAEITPLVDISGWPEGSRLLVRREPLHPGAQQTFHDIDGFRFTAFLTDQPEGDLAVLDARHRAHTRIEDRIRAAKNLGLRTLPCNTFARNHLWLQLVLAA